MSTKTKVTIRTVIQVILGLAVVAPLLVDRVGGAEAVPWLAGAVAVSGVVTRFMASETGQKLMGFLNTADETADKK
ncbi:membrane protein [Streptomyces phage Dryad]|nr:membrane protein [Streptomyces phage Dryad]